MHINNLTIKAATLKGHLFFSSREKSISFPQNYSVIVKFQCKYEFWFSNWARPCPRRSSPEVHRCQSNGLQSFLCPV